MPAILDDALMEELKSKTKTFETVPRWVELVEPPDRQLIIPDPNGKVLELDSDDDVDSEMRRKNILTFTLPALFI